MTEEYFVPACHRVFMMG